MKHCAHHLIDIARKTIRETGMIKRGGKLVVAVSGGPDSVALLHVLNNLKEEFETALAVAHLDHTLRPDSESDARFVESIAERLGIEFHLKTSDVRRTAITKGISIEEAGRVERYNFFREVAELTGAVATATAHHFDDSAETFFMRVMRGTSLSGMRGIPPIRGNIIRPFIRAYRSNILDFLEVGKVAYRTDFTNALSDADRNFIRNNVLPIVETRFADFRKPLRRSLDLLEKEERFLDQLAGDLYSKAVVDSGESADYPDSAILIDIPALESENEVLVARVLLAAFHRFGGAEIRWLKKHVDAAIGLLNKRGGSRTVHLPQNMIVRRQYDKLIITRKRKETAHSFNLVISSEGVFDLPDGNRFKIAMIEASSAEVRFDSSRAFFDGEIIDFPITVRYPLPGDRLKPWGINGTKKLKNLFIDLKIPAEKRKEIPVVLKANEIIWIPGIRRSSTAPITPSTSRFLLMELSGV